MSKKRNTLTPVVTTQWLDALPGTLPEQSKIAEKRMDQLIKKRLECIKHIKTILGQT